LAGYYSWGVSFFGLFVALARGSSGSLLGVLPVGVWCLFLLLEANGGVFNVVTENAALGYVIAARAKL